MSADGLWRYIGLQMPCARCAGLRRARSKLSRFLRPELKARSNLAASQFTASGEETEVAIAGGELLREQARDEAEILRRGVRNEVRDQAQRRADVIRERAEMRRAQLEQIRIRVNPQFRLASTTDGGVTVSCPGSTSISADADADSF